MTTRHGNGTTPAARLSAEDVARYHEEGYIAVDDVLTDEEVAELQRVTDNFVEQSRQVTEHTDVFDLEPGHTPEQPRLRRLKSPDKQHVAYDRVLRNDRILDLVSQLIGPGIRYKTTKLNLKSPEYGSPVEWHQDWAFYPHTNDDLLAVGVAIDDMMLENGCLMVVPGSHKGPVLDHHRDGYFAGAVAPDGLSGRAVPIELRAGGISLHHARLLHGSAPNTSSRPRRLLLFEYAAADAWPLTGGLDWDDFNAHLLRGDAVLQPRLTEVPVRIPLPTHDREGSIYEVQSIVADRGFGST
ncbi:phytanoyl-CoA dioxygenase family protein [Actinopolymorpha rutila]|uniref:Ectoine hydroxylase-related dioxygenase (Phytanoyl-CoA dioxygenase family) n=1 Tax=Actinopolymorpha rutila TaxID=446787 RepID=A0A852ZJZ6_9ACTN|nr:phytanoyl-CoA dioxygenase family protein [Actinopolymorpha rutila]NYH92228.1 ectoine hydroxylase-related dioxygenase (phytanoyl-CoA dioxygenase family) [Actinopolymorpha rutila]